MLDQTDRPDRSTGLGRDATGSELRAAVCAAVVAVWVNSFGSRMRSIVLTGSMSRSEATFVWSSEDWVVLGDAEFFVIFEGQYALPQNKLAESLRQQIERILIENGIRCHIDLHPVHPRYLTGLQPHILAHELKQCGEVVWGDTEVLNLIPNFSVSDIPLEDAWRLLSNRIVEYLAVAAELTETRTPQSSAVFYLTAKLYLDMATSFLLFAGAYEPTYRARAAQLRGLASAPSHGLKPPFPLLAFAHRVDSFTAFKLQQPGYPEFDPTSCAGDECVSSLRDAVEYAHRLWRWELRQLTRPATELSDRELMREWMYGQSMSRRLRGWVRVFRDTGWRSNWSDWPRWMNLARRASPRHWVYAAAVEIFFRLPALVGVSDTDGQDDFDPCSICRWLPCSRLPSARESSPPWPRAAALVVSNYYRFVAITRA